MLPLFLSILEREGISLISDLITGNFAGYHHISSIMSESDARRIILRNMIVFFDRFVNIICDDGFSINNTVQDYHSVIFSHNEGVTFVVDDVAFTISLGENMEISEIQDYQDKWESRRMIAYNPRILEERLTVIDQLLQHIHDSYKDRCRNGLISEEFYSQHYEELVLRINSYRSFIRVKSAAKSI